MLPTRPACARLLPPHSQGPDQPLPVIGRVVVAVQARSQGQGRALMLQAAIYAGVPATNAAFRWARDVLGDDTGD